MRRRNKLWTGAAVAVLLAGCASEDPTGPRRGPVPPDPNTVVTTISGIVRDEFGNPAVAARIESHGRISSTGDNGEFFLLNLRVPRHRALVTCSNLGSFTTSHGAVPVENGVTELRLVLPASPPSGTFAAASGGSVTFADGSSLGIDGATLVGTDSVPYDGTATVTGRTYDPTTPGFALRIPGGDLVAVDASVDTTQLFAYGVLRLLLADAVGMDLGLAAGARAAVGITIPVALQASAPATIALWALDEASGTWTESGVATRVGDRYEADVDRFGTWACAEPGVAAGDVCGRVVDPLGRAVPGVVVEIGPWIAIAGADGRFCAAVDAARDLVARVDPATNAGIGAGAVNIPSFAPAARHDLGDLVTTPVARLRGAVTCVTTPNVAGVYLRCGTGGVLATTTDAGGLFDVALPPGAPASLVVASLVNGRLAQRQVDAVAADAVSDLGTVNPCGMGFLLVLIQAPLTGSTVTENVVNVEGTVTDQTIRVGTLYVNGQPQTMAINRGEFTSTAVLMPGINTVRARVSTAAGAVAATQVNVRFQGAPIALTANLTWDTNTTDIDLHMLNPLGEECYFVYTNTGGMRLDVDDRDGYGPENTSVLQPMNGTYHVRVRNYRNTVPTLATVRVYKGAALVDTRTNLFGTTSVFWDVGDYTLP